MATWGIHIFDNAAALQWFYELRATPDLVLLINPLLRLEANPGCNFAPCEEALATAEIIAALLGAPAATLPAEIRDWTQTMPLRNVATFAPMAAKAVQHILADSWLQNKWCQNVNGCDWCEQVADLERRLMEVAQLAPAPLHV
jgi:hypothetical protein